MKGKEKCEFLKGIRKRMAEANGIPYEPRECTFEGDCTGTCPFCEKEAAELLAKLKEKEAEGAVIKTDNNGISTIELMQVCKDADEDEDLETMRKEQEKSALLAMYQQQQATMGVIRWDEEEESRSRMEVEKLMDELKRLIEDSDSTLKENSDE